MNGKTKKANFESHRNLKRRNPAIQAKDPNQTKSARKSNFKTQKSKTSHTSSDSHPTQTTSTCTFPPPLLLFIYSFTYYILKKKKQIIQNINPHQILFFNSLLHFAAMFPMVLSQVATGLSVLAGAVLVKSVLDQKPMAGSFPRCPTCNGTGRVSCLCSRWSDGDVGCRTCAGSGRMACSSCGGTGSGRPLPAKITVQLPNRPSWFAGLVYWFMYVYTNIWYIGMF